MDSLLRVCDNIYDLLSSLGFELRSTVMDMDMTRHGDTLIPKIRHGHVRDSLFFLYFFRIYVIYIFLLWLWRIVFVGGGGLFREVNASVD